MTRQSISEQLRRLISAISRIGLPEDDTLIKSYEIIPSLQRFKEELDHGPLGPGTWRMRAGLLRDKAVLLENLGTIDRFAAYAGKFPKIINDLKVLADEADAMAEE